MRRFVWDNCPSCGQHTLNVVTKRCYICDKRWSDPDDNTELSNDPTKSSPTGHTLPESAETPMKPSDNCVTWTFDLSEPEGERRLRECLDAPRVKAAVSELDQWLRAQVKYYSDDYDESVIATFLCVRDELHNVFENNGISVWDE